MIVKGTAPAAPRPAVSAELSPAEALRLLAVDKNGAIQGVAFLRSNGGMSHVWHRVGEDFGGWASGKVASRKPGYVTMAAFDPDKVTDYSGRAQANVVGVGGFWIDVEGSVEKGGYPGARAVLEAVRAFLKATGLKFNVIVFTGSGGVHLHFVLTEPILPGEWLPRAQALVALAAKQGFKIDAQCTTDAARVMRAPGSIHQKTGVLVTARRGRGEPYTLDEFDTLVGYDPAANPAPATGARVFDLSVNGDVIGSDRGRYSYIKAASRCEAMRLAAADGGKGTAYPVWILALKAADLSTEGRDFAHEISGKHADYDEGKTEGKLNGLTGGPAGCVAWATAYGAGGPCDRCALKGQIKNPAVQLGSIEPAPGAVKAGEAGEVVPEWAAELNARFALARVGSKMIVVDFRTPMAGMLGGAGVGMGYLDIGAFRASLEGRFVPSENPKDKPRPLAQAWLSNPQRRQYEGIEFAPGQDLPANLLNTWQGFAVEPALGDVGPWLEVLRALVPDESERLYVLRWLAWKVQNPGGVPDTILILRGAKGTGKNSLFDPIIAAFGRHAMLAADPELIAGRFTGHLMNLAFAVLDEAVFVGDPRQADRIKSRVTAKTMHFEQKGMDPVSGVNRCAYVMLTNHTHVWQATTDERRAVIVDVGEGLRGKLTFWQGYHSWASGPGVGALLHHLQSLDLTGFNPRDIPRGESLRMQTELTALRDPAAAWWHQCLSEGVIDWNEGRVWLGDAHTEIVRSNLRLSFERSAVARGRAAGDWAVVARKLAGWVGAGGTRKIRKRTVGGREWVEEMAPLRDLRAAFTEKTKVAFDGEP